MISSNNLDEEIRFLLDAEGDDHYGEAEDIVPAINMSVRWVCAIINDALGQRKLGEEIFHEIHTSTILRTSKDSRFNVELVSDNLWTITAIFIEPTTGDNGGGAPAMPNEYEAYERTDLYFVAGDKAARRLSLEEWGPQKNNPFAKGYDGDQICDELKDYAYLNGITYKTAEGSPPQNNEVTIRPTVDKGTIAVFYVDKPTPIDQLGDDDIALPGSVQSLVVNKALQYISYKQGDRTNLFTVTASDIVQLVHAIS
jgi:hypothetical protein